MVGIRTLAASSLASLALTFFTGFASAQITEPDGFGPVPIDPRAQCNKGNTSNTSANGTIGCTGTADIGDFNCCSNTLDNMSLIGLFKYYETDTSGNVLIDFQKDAKTEPATFNPLCSIQGNLVMHGGGCQVGFGWYCVDDSKSYTNQPTIHPLITAADIQAYSADPGNVFPTAWKNNDGAFLPKTSYSIAGKKLQDLANDSDFKACASKKIGFAVIGGKGTDGQGVCTQNKFTETRLNQVNSTSGKPYVAAIIYASKNYPGRFYIGVEDLPTDASKFNAAVPGKSWTADGDFNDFVYTVEGVVCQGGGQLCTVPGKTGLCATGVTTCVTDPGATPSCDPVFKPQTETCNAIDDDCDGTIDNGDNLCPNAGEICYKGTCVHECQATGEFSCPADKICVAQYCIDKACANVNCAADQKCVGGTCVGGCSDVKCTAGQQCVAGKCVDLCDVRSKAGLSDCPENFVCQNGACVPNCTCLACPDSSQECQSDRNKAGFGRCVASGCGSVTCPDGQLCIPGGTCTDPCANNSCGANQTCKPNAIYDATNPDRQYSCSNPDGSTSAGGTGASTGGGSNICFGCGQGNNTSSGNNGSVGGSHSQSYKPASSSEQAGCGCRVGGRSVGSLAVAGLAGLALLVVRRRRR